MPASTQAQQHAVERAAKIFTILKRCADSNLSVPSNVDLARRFGVRAPAINNALHFLVANGMIEVRGKGGERTVTICSTGKTTLPSAPLGRNRSKPKLKRNK